jgi:hypothetical protein
MNESDRRTFVTSAGLEECLYDSTNGLGLGLIWVNVESEGDY